MTAEQNIKSLMKAADMLKAISNPKRLAILCWLDGGEKSVSEIAEFSQLSQSALSQHLAGLRAKKLVKTRRDQQSIYYSLASRELKSIIDVLHELYCDNNS